MKFGSNLAFFLHTHNFQCYFFQKVKSLNVHLQKKIRKNSKKEFRKNLKKRYIYYNDKKKYFLIKNKIYFFNITLFYGINKRFLKNFE